MHRRHEVNDDGAVIAARAPLAATTRLYHTAHLQDRAVLIHLRYVHPRPHQGQEKCLFLHQDLSLNVADVNDVFMLPSKQLPVVGLFAAEQCQCFAALQACSSSF